MDTVSGIYDLAFDFTCERKKMDHPEDEGHGKGWRAVRDEFLGAMTRFVYLANKYGSTVIMIDHTKEIMIETTLEKAYPKVSCSMPGQARSIIMPIPDHIWFIGYEQDSGDPNDALKNTASGRALYLGGSSRIEAGCRDPKVKKRMIAPLSKKDPYTQILKELYGVETA